MIDYAMPCMKAEKSLKDAHNAVIEGKLDLAMEHTLAAITETRMMLHSINFMKEKQDAIDLR